MLSERIVRVGNRQWNMAVGPQTGPPLLLLHGVTRRWQSFLPLLPQLILRHQIWALDHRGHGGSDPADRYLVADYCDDVFAVIRQEIPGPFRIYGHSLGAMVAAAAAAEFAGRVQGVILEDPPWQTMGDRIASTPLLSMFQAYQAVAEFPAGDDERLQRLVDWEIHNPQDNSRRRLGDLRDRMSLRFTVNCLKRLDPRVLAPIVERRWLEGLDIEGIVSQIRSPALLLQADLRTGGMLTDEDAEWMCRLNPRIHRHQFLSAPHLIHWFETQQVLNLAVNFFESLDR